MLKKSLSIFIFLCCTAVFAQKVAVLTGPSGIPCAVLMENKAFDFEVFPSAQTMLPKLIKGEVDIGFLPPNAAAKVYNSSKGAIVTAGITGNGNLFLITTKDNINSLKDLENKTVSCAGMGATPEYIVRYLLKKENIKNVTLDFSTPNPQIGPLVAESKIESGIVPEPFASTALLKNPSVRLALNISEEYKKLEGKDFPMTLLVINAKYAATHKKEVKKFIKEYEKAQKWTLNNPEKAGLLTEKNGLGLKAKPAEKAVPNCAFTWLESNKKECVEQTENLLSLFLEFAPEAIGGKLPDSGFYFK